MYSRYPERSQRPIQIPEHYSGCAFSAGSGTRLAPEYPRKAPPAASSYPGPTVFPKPTTSSAEKSVPSKTAVPPAEKSAPEKPPAPPPSENGSCQEEKKISPSSPPPPDSSGPLPVPHPHRKPEECASGKGLHGLLHGSSFPFSEGMDFDELLILGIMLLLSRGEGDSDLLPLLALLLFCG